MKDLYSFDVNEEALDVSYQKCTRPILIYSLDVVLI